MDSTGADIGASSFSNNYGFTGRYLDNETGLWYFRARYFDNEMGRFISRDPLGYVDGMSLYGGYFAQYFSLDPWGLKLTIDPTNKKFLKAISDMLKQLCSKVSVDAKGNVSIEKGPYGKTENAACCCLEKVINNTSDNKIKFATGKLPFTVPKVRGDENPRRRKPGEKGPVRPDGAFGPGKGTSGTVFWDPRRGTEEKRKGKWVPNPAWLILGHEICGHILKFNLGTQKHPGPPVRAGAEPNHEEEAVDEEDILRKEKGLPPRPPGYADPKNHRPKTFPSRM